jgi:hypothetical protein
MSESQHDVEWYWRPGRDRMVLSAYCSCGLSADGFTTAGMLAAWTDWHRGATDADTVDQRHVRVAHCI